MAPSGNDRSTWLSLVDVSDAAVPLGPSGTLLLADTGFWLLAANSLGGLTQWYGGGPLKPSNSGRRPSGPGNVKAATTRYSATSAPPASSRRSTERAGDLNVRWAAARRRDWRMPAARRSPAGWARAIPR